MSNPLKAVGKVFKKVVKVVKKVAPIALAVGAVVLTGGAAIGALPAVGTMVGSLGLGAGLTSVLTGAVTSAGIGGALGFITGGKKGLLSGALTGAVTGGVLNGVAGAGINAGKGTLSAAMPFDAAASTNATFSAMDAATKSGFEAAGLGSSGASAGVGAAGSTVGAAGSQAAASAANAATLVGKTQGGGLLSSVGNLAPIIGPAIGGLGQGIAADATAKAEAKEAQARRDQFAANYSGLPGSVTGGASSDPSMPDATERFNAPGMFVYDKERGQVVWQAMGAA